MWKEGAGYVEVSHDGALSGERRGFCLLNFDGFLSWGRMLFLPFFDLGRERENNRHGRIRTLCCSQSIFDIDPQLIVFVFAAFYVSLIL